MQNILSSLLNCPFCQADFIGSDHCFSWKWKRLLRSKVSKTLNVNATTKLEMSAPLNQSEPLYVTTRKNAIYFHYSHMKGSNSKCYSVKQLDRHPVLRHSCETKGRTIASTLYAYKLVELHSQPFIEYLPALFVNGSKKACATVWSQVWLFE